MRVLIVIPARFASVRFPGKPLQMLTGKTGLSKTLVQRSWEAAMAVAGGRDCVIATEDQRIMDAAAAFGARAILTSDTCRNGTERAAEALALSNADYDLVVNLQGDAPLTPPWFVDALIQAMSTNPDIQMATPVLKADDGLRAALLNDRTEGRVGGTTAVFRPDGQALYFSKEVLPYGGDVFHHVGVYAYRPAALKSYLGWAPGRLELAEGLEQLRFLENGVPVHCIEVEDRGRPFWEVNNPEDVPKVEAMLKDIGLE